MNSIIAKKGFSLYWDDIHNFVWLASGNILSGQSWEFNETFSGLMTSSSEQLAVMRPAYMNLPSPNITCPEEEEDGHEDPGGAWSGWSPPGPGQGGDTHNLESW